MVQQSISNLDFALFACLHHHCSPPTHPFHDCIVLIYITVDCPPSFSGNLVQLSPHYHPIDPSRLLLRKWYSLVCMQTNEMHVETSMDLSPIEYRIRTSYPAHANDDISTCKSERAAKPCKRWSQSLDLQNGRPRMLRSSQSVAWVWSGVIWLRIHASLVWIRGSSEKNTSPVKAPIHQLWR